MERDEYLPSRRVVTGHPRRVGRLPSRPLRCLRHLLLLGPARLQGICKYLQDQSTRRLRPGSRRSRSIRRAPIRATCHSLTLIAPRSSASTKGPARRRARPRASPPLNQNGLCHRRPRQSSRGRVGRQPRCPISSRPGGTVPRNNTAIPSESARQTTPDTWRGRRPGLMNSRSIAAPTAYPPLGRSLAPRELISTASKRFRSWPARTQAVHDTRTRGLARRVRCAPPASCLMCPYRSRSDKALASRGLA
jgi:hypothetical protein